MDLIFARVAAPSRRTNSPSDENALEKYSDERITGPASEEKYGSREADRNLSLISRFVRNKTFDCSCHFKSLRHTAAHLAWPPGADIYEL